MSTVQLLDNVQTGLAAAKTPEQAAKMFHEIVSAGLAKLIGDALAEVKTKAVAAKSATTASIDGWDSFVTGCNIKIDWPTPYGTPVQIGTPILYRTSENSSALGVSGSISIGINIGF